MNICFFGIYKSNDLRLNFLTREWKNFGINIIECRSGQAGLKKYWELIVKYWRLKKDFKIIFIPFPGYQAAVLAGILSRKPIIFDAFNSIYDSAVCDRRQVKQGSFKAKYYFILNKLACQFADIIILDTREHIKYFIETFKIKPAKFRQLWAGSDDRIFYPRDEDHAPGNFNVYWHGTFIPLHGIEYILQAAKILANETITFNLVGNGQTFSAMNALKEELNLTKVNFIASNKAEKLADLMNEADLCLGIFGSTPKAARVIPFKVFDALAMAKPVLTGNSPAIQELLKNEASVLLCNPADPKDLAEKILILKNDPVLRKKIAQNGYEIFQKKLSVRILSARLWEIISERLQ
ncbi:MAG: glycosyltransferase [Candidatus Komeilibacteria bacterium]|nr:glycosyltransferase [Candidatus Komeilibacteria bacterium]